MSRFLGALACLSPFAIVLFSMLSHRPGRPSAVAIILLVSACLLTVLNLWLSHGRALTHKSLHGNLTGFRLASGFPLLGSILATLALITGFGSLWIAVVAAASLVLDTGGAPWFLVSTWRDNSLWNRQAKS
jgi:hypothetical protein